MLVCIILKWRALIVAKGRNYITNEELVQEASSFSLSS